MSPITTDDHLAFLGDQHSASFLQTPAWAQVKSEWAAESVGFFRDGSLVGAGLVLYRQMPRLPWSLAYLPEGPVLDWDSPEVPDMLSALAAHVKAKRAFGIRIGPPVPSRTWHTATIKQAIADGRHQRLGDVPADERHATGSTIAVALRAAGWRSQTSDDGFGVGQPQYVFQLPLEKRTEDDVLAGMNQLWRRNIKKAAKEGVEVTLGGGEDLRAFHRLYAETAERDGFTPRPLSYFQRMFSAMRAEDPDRIRLYLAHHEGTLVAATTWVRVGRHVWYSYGASSTEKRDVRGSNAIQWQMMRDAIAAGADVYDLRGITDTLDPADSHVGLIQFKLGTGGQAVEYVGEWDLPLNRALYRAFTLYMSRR